MSILSNIISRSRLKARDESGTTTVEFALFVPVIVIILVSSFEVGLWSTRQVMLEHGLDKAVREVRIGLVDKPSHEQLIGRICEHAGIIPDCKNQLRLEMIPVTVPNINTGDLTADFKCRDRSEDSAKALVEFKNAGENNDLMVLRACALFDPLVAHLGIGKSISKQDGGGLALYASSGYVMEPFQ